MQRLSHFLIDFVRWRLERPLLGSPTWHVDMVRWKSRRPRYRRKGSVRTPTLRDWGYAKHQDRLRQRRSFT